jgi:hypothetical protein
MSWKKIYMLFVDGGRCVYKIQRKEKSIYGTECKAIKCKQNQNLSVAKIITW